MSKTSNIVIFFLVIFFASSTSSCIAFGKKKQKQELTKLMHSLSQYEGKYESVPSNFKKTTDTLDKLGRPGLNRHERVNLRKNLCKHSCNSHSCKHLSIFYGCLYYCKDPQKKRDAIWSPGHSSNFKKCIKVGKKAAEKHKANS